MFVVFLVNIKIGVCILLFVVCGIVDVLIICKFFILWIFIVNGLIIVIGSEVGFILVL